MYQDMVTGYKLRHTSGEATAVADTQTHVQAADFASQIQEYYARKTLYQK